MAKITIFGMAGTGKTSAGKAVAEKLGYKFYSAGNFARETAAKFGMTIDELEQLSKTDDKYDRERDKITEEFGKNNDNFVVEARLAWHFIPDSFKIRFICDFNLRTERIALREGKDVEQVRRETRAREDAIYERFANYYNITDLENGNSFDLTINTGDKKLEEVVEEIVAKIKEKYNS